MQDVSDAQKDGTRAYLEQLLTTVAEHEVLGMDKGEAIDKMRNWYGVVLVPPHARSDKTDTRPQYFLEVGDEVQ